MLTIAQELYSFFCKVILEDSSTVGTSGLMKKSLGITHICIPLNVQTLVSKNAVSI